MPLITEDDIARVALGMTGCTLPKAEWTHEAHFAATLWLMRHRPDLDLPVVMPGLIRAYNESVGGRNTDTEGYHETITQASLIMTRRELARHMPDAPLPVVLAALMTSPLGRSDWILTYWSRETLFSVDARRCWVKPDLKHLGPPGARC